MGFRSKIKGRLKAVLSRDESPIDDSAIPEKHRKTISEDQGGGNLRNDGDDDVPWYLKYEDNDGWESTDAKPDVDED